MGATNKLDCMECGFEWSPERDTPAKGFREHYDPIEKKKMIYSRCPQCGHRWYAYERAGSKVVQGTGFGSGTPRTRHGRR